VSQFTKEQANSFINNTYKDAPISQLKVVRHYYDAQIDHTKNIQKVQHWFVEALDKLINNPSRLICNILYPVV